MSEPQPSPPSLRECFQALFRHRKKIFTLYGFALAVAIGVLLLYPRTYVSSAKLYVRMGRENTTVDPTVTTSQMVMVQRSQENEINSLLDILQSRWMAERVVDAVGVEPILAREASPKVVAALSKGTGPAVASAFSGNDPTRLLRSWAQGVVAAVSDPVSDRDVAIKKLRESIEVRAPKESTVITISSKAGSPELAQQITSAMTDAFLEAHLRLNRTQGTHQFFAEQSSMLHDKLTKVSQELRDRKNDFGILSIEGKRQALEQQISAIQLEARTTDREMAASQTRASALKEQLASASLQATQTVDGVAHDAWDKMREKLYELEIAQLEANTKYTDEYPGIEAMERQREEAANILKSQAPQRTQVTTAPNPTYQALELELSKQLAEVASLQASHDLLARQAADLSNELTAVNNQELQIKELERQAALLEANYRTHEDKLEEARIDDALENERISSLNVVQPATLEGKPVSPKKALTLLSAFVIATFGGLVVVFLSEQSNPKLYTSEEAEAALDLPVLASIPRKRHRPVGLNGGRIKR